ncbi:hypothetical protein AURDEDRAFT_152297 [Auricularia subglabra TFB-10046 SS5]|nr:hypothetical protein AURDEDRAFT_152297 [Auricularia subglabra TFB-10046 SS5]
MSGIALLPDDLTNDIMLLVDDKSTEQKFALAQVSRRWRSLALSSPLLWSSFRVAAKLDWARLPTLLARTGSSSLLDAELLVDSDDTTPSYPRTAALVPYTSRLRTLDVRLLRAGCTLAPLLDGDSQLFFPALGTLRVWQGGQIYLNCAAAPMLRVLDLTRVCPLSPAVFFHTSVEEMRLIMCLVAASLLPVLECCPNIRRFTFHTLDYAESHASGLSYVPEEPLAPNLQFLDLQLALGDIVHVLDTAFGGRVLPEVSASIYNGHDEEDMVALCGTLLQGLGALTAFEVHDDQCIVLRDATGRIRTMRVWNEDSYWDIPIVWCHLSSQYAIHASVRYVQIATKYWNDLADALAECPLQTTQGLTMRILTDWEDVHMYRKGDMCDMPDVAVPGLDCVDMACIDGTGLPAQVVVHILRRLVLGDTRSLNVVLASVFASAGTVPEALPLEIQEYDNSNNINTSITRNVEVVHSKTIRGKDYSKVVNETSRETANKLNVNVSASATWGSVSATVSSGFETAHLLRDFVSSTTEVAREDEQTWSQKETNSFTIGPGDKLYFYQQVFTGPGISFALDTTSVTSSKKTAADGNDIDIIVRSRAIEFIKDITVVYGDSQGLQPNDRVREATGQSDDINFDFEGKYVWLVPQYTYNTNEAATSFELRTQGGAVRGMSDLAVGAGGAYRYLVAIKDSRQTKKLVELKLLRDNGSITAGEVPGRLGSNHWTGLMQDINVGRKKTWLYLVWRLY